MAGRGAGGTKWVGAAPVAEGAETVVGKKGGKQETGMLSV